MSVSDTDDLRKNYKDLCEQKTMLVQQLTMFEQDSFEIQAKVKRGLDAQKLNEKTERTLDQMKERERELTRQLEQM